MFADGQRQVIFPETPYPAAVFLSVFVNIQVNPGGLCVDVGSDFAGGIKGFCIGQVIHQLGKRCGHFIGVIRRQVLVFQPAVLIFLYKKGFPQ